MTCKIAPFDKIFLFCFSRSPCSPHDGGYRSLWEQGQGFEDTSYTFKEFICRPKYPLLTAWGDGIAGLEIPYFNAIEKLCLLLCSKELALNFFCPSKEIVAFNGVVCSFEKAGQEIHRLYDADTGILCHLLNSLIFRDIDSSKYWIAELLHRNDPKRVEEGGYTCREIAEGEKPGIHKEHQYICQRSIALHEFVQEIKKEFEK